MKTWVISDTHGWHKSLQVPEGIDTIIHAGDSTNAFNLYTNIPEFHDFKIWFLDLPIKNKILIAGNHDAWATKRYNIDDLKSQNVIYLEHEAAIVEGKTIFGSPYTPTFGNWHFMKDRAKLSRYWEILGTNIDILITHGPPKGILDLTENRDYTLEQVGDGALYKKVIKVKPTYHIFGHVHDVKQCRNAGILQRDGITFINAAVVEDGKFEQGPINNGHIINI